MASILEMFRILIMFILPLDGLTLASVNTLNDVDKIYSLPIRSPKFSPRMEDSYLSTAEKLPENETYYIVGFNPLATMDTVHHMIVRGCREAITLQKGSVQCLGSDTLLYAWAKNAPPLRLPDKVGMKIGLETNIRYIIVQIHYARKFSEGEFDKSGVELMVTTATQPYLAGVFLLATNGFISPRSNETFDVACRLKDDVVLYPFRFRTHAHDRGILVEGYRVRQENNSDTWTLIGKKSPQEPQFFYPVETNDLEIRTGDIMAARCSMQNKEYRYIYVGDTHNDEMCNFYFMFYVKDGKFPIRRSCVSSGPPHYRWSHDPLLSGFQIPA